MQRGFAVTAGALLLLPAALGAQSGYRFTSGDTLRYREQTAGVVSMQFPQGQVGIRSTQTATIGITASGQPGTVEAWYDALEVTQEGVTPRPARPSTASLLRKPFQLRVTATGQVSVDSVPAIPADIASMTDLTRQFDDFLISVPAGRLSRGSRWADTLEHTRPGRPGDTYRGHRVRNFRVRGDTIVNGKAAVVIEVTQQATIHGSAPVPGQSATATTQLTGTETGIAVFSPSLGRLLVRVREGNFTGQVVVSPGGAPPIPQSYVYQSTLTAAP